MKVVGEIYVWIVRANYNVMNEYSGLESRQGQSNSLLHSVQTPIQLVVPEAVSHEAKRPLGKANNFPPSLVEVKNSCNC
jgi:hypothetical protein